MKKFFQPINDKVDFSNVIESLWWENDFKELVDAAHNGPDLAQAELPSKATLKKKPRYKMNEIFYVEGTKVRDIV